MIPKNILNTKYGGNSEIVNAFVQNIMYLSFAAETNEISATLVHRQFNDQGTVFYDIDLFKFYSLYLQRELKLHSFLSTTTQFQVLNFILRRF